MKEIVVKYSGGTDSTAATALLAEKYDRVHLLTFRHSGIMNVENSSTNIKKLSELYGKEKFTHTIMDIENLASMVAFEDYFSNIRKHGFFVLGSCGLCKLSMHIRALIFCLDNNITEVADGANKNSSHFPAQMDVVLDEYKKMYGRFGVKFHNPVFDYEFPDEIYWQHKFGLVPADKPKEKGMTTGKVLSSKGILDKDNVKGTETDRKMQALCFQLLLLNIFALKYYIPRYGMEKYREATGRFYKERIGHFSERIEEFLNKREDSRLGRVIVPQPVSVTKY